VKREDDYAWLRIGLTADRWWIVGLFTGAQAAMGTDQKGWLYGCKRDAQGEITAEACWRPAPSDVAPEMPFHWQAILRYEINDWYPVQKLPDPLTEWILALVRPQEASRESVPDELRMLADG
jgi:hypothetical protein